MTITELNPVGITGDRTATKPQVLGKDDFLNLLVAQLKNQDPLNPTDSTEFTAQLAQFSSLEQLSNINENLEYLQGFQNSINNSQAVSFIGKDVKVNGNSIMLSDGISDAINFELEEDAGEVYVNIYDDTGGFVNVIEGGPLSAGEQTINWDGNDKNGNGVFDGKYKFEVLATDADGNMINTKTYITGRVTAVVYKNGISYLVAGDQEVPVGDVIRIAEAKEEI